MLKINFETLKNICKHYSLIKKLCMQGNNFAGQCCKDYCPFLKNMDKSETNK